jgi:hypothetical protein
MLYKEITAIYCVNRAKHNTLCGQNKISCVRLQSEQQLFALSYMSLAPTLPISVKSNLSYFFF